MNEVPMTFDRIERLTRTKLPESANRYRAWWSNNPQNSVMTRVWLEAGFESAQVNLKGRRLVFRRTERAANSARPGDNEGTHQASAVTGRHPLIGALKGLIHIEPGTDLTAPADPAWGEQACED